MIREAASSPEPLHHRYDLYWHNLSDEEHEELAGVAEETEEDFIRGLEQGSGSEAAALLDRGGPSLIYEAMRATGWYERADEEAMRALCAELRSQGARRLADAIWNDGRVGPTLILDQLQNVSVLPSGPHDYEHVAPLESDPERATADTPPRELATTESIEWALTWARLVSFLVSAACQGDGVDVTRVSAGLPITAFAQGSATARRHEDLDTPTTRAPRKTG